jgi:hypothetical protein
VGTETVDLVGKRRTGGGHRTFEIADAVVGPAEDGREGSQRVAPCSQRPARTIVEHDVAGKERQIGRRGERCRGGQQGRKQGLDGLHRRTFARCSHQNSSSLSRTGS